MPTFPVAHLREVDSHGQEVHLIIIPLEESFRLKTVGEKLATLQELQSRATGAQLRGTVCLVWEESGRLQFYIPDPKWRPYFETLNMPMVAASINREIRW